MAKSWPPPSMTSATTLLKHSYCLQHQNHKTLCLLAKPLTTRLEGKKRSITTKYRLGETSAPYLPVLMQITLPAGYATVEIEKI